MPPLLAWAGLEGLRSAGFLIGGCQESSRGTQSGWTAPSSSQTTAFAPAFPQLSVFPAERAERHDAQEILQIARDLVHKVQMLIENK